MRDLHRWCSEFGGFFILANCDIHEGRSKFGVFIHAKRDLHGWGSEFIGFLMFANRNIHEGVSESEGLFGS